MTNFKPPLRCTFTISLFLTHCIVYIPIYEYDFTGTRFHLFKFVNILEKFQIRECLPNEEIREFFIHFLRQTMYDEYMCIADKIKQFFQVSQSFFFLNQATNQKEVRGAIFYRILQH